MRVLIRDFGVTITEFRVLQRYPVGRLIWTVGAPVLLALAVLLGMAAVSPRPSTPATVEQGQVASPSDLEAPLAPLTPSEVPTSPAITRPSTGSASHAISIAFGGDVHGEKQIRRALEAGRQPLAALAPVLSAADLAIVNLETAVGDGGQAADKQHTFLAPRALLAALGGAGVDVVSLANNHSLDYGWTTLRSGLHWLAEAGLAAVGAGENAAEAYAPHVVEVRGRRVAVVGLTRVIPRREWAAGNDRPGVASGYDLRTATAAVRAATAVADHVVVVVHWGAELANCPDDKQVTLGRALQEAGADVVVGHHPHVLQGIDHESGRLIAYSLGNLLWYSTGPATRLSGVLSVTLGPEGVVGWQFHPAIVDPSGAPLLAGVEDDSRAHERLTLLPAHPACLA
ncbi:MAG: CapA family protein, partial [Actinomycetota bacterium]|nr:CapA family protein [Actinomycetota bacterium]